MVSAKLKNLLESMHYELVGRHSALSICHWVKKSLLDKDFCYKQKFYGIQSHRCCQMSPVLDCNQLCVFCWRPIEHKEKLPKKTDAPEKIIDECISAQRKKLSGFKGNPKANLKKFWEAQEPMHFAISLTGEPTLYPKLPELINELHKRGKTTFLVTNGSNPEMLLKLKRKKALPTQLYVSLTAYDETSFRKINRSSLKNGWKNLNKTLELLPKLDCRKVIRITLVKGLNDKHPEKYAKLISKALPDFIEVKAYMHLGYSGQRLKRENMPLHEDVLDFSGKLAKHLKGYKIKDQKENSRVVLLAKPQRH